MITFHLINKSNTLTMSNEIIQIRLYKVLRKMGIDRSEFNFKTDFYFDLCFDDFDTTILLFHIETKFDININDCDICELKTIGSTLSFLRNKLNAA